MSIPVSKLAPQELKGHYKFEIFNKQGDLINTVEQDNKIWYTMEDSGLNFYKFAMETFNGSSRPYQSRVGVCEGYNGGSYPATLLLFEDATDQEIKYVIPSEIVGAASLGYNATPDNPAYGSYSTAESGAFIEGDYLIWKDVYEFSTLQANGTISAAGLLGRNPRMGNGTTLARKAAASIGAAIPASYIAAWGPAKEMARLTMGSFAFNHFNKVVDIKNDVVISNYEKAFAGLEAWKTRPCEAKDRIFSPQVLPNGIHYYTVEWAKQTKEISGVSVSTRIATIRIRNIEDDAEIKTVTLDILEACPKISPYVTSQENYISEMFAAEYFNGYMTVAIQLKSRSGYKLPKLMEDGSYTENTLNYNTAYGLYDIANERWVAEPDFLNIKTGLYYNTAGTAFGPKGLLFTAYSVLSGAKYVATTGTNAYENRAARWSLYALTQVVGEPTDPMIITVDTINGGAGFMAPVRGKGGWGPSPYGTTDPRNGIIVGGTSNVSSPNDTNWSFCHGQKRIPCKSHVLLDTPIVKTSENTMKVTYTLSMRVPNIFAAPGKEYEFDVDEA